MTISKGVMKIHDWRLGNKHGSGATYRIACSCGEPSHDCVIMFDLEDGIMQMHFYKKLVWTPWYRDNWFKKIWERIKAARKILFTGWIEMEDELTIDVNFIPDIIKVFQESQENLEVYQKECEEALRKLQESKKENN